jgi:4-hydroxy-tetrahydrodipicolinate synthase
MQRSDLRPQSRRGFLGGLAGAAIPATTAARAAGGKQLRGIFPIVATPYTEDKQVDYDDLAKEVGFLDQCGVHGIVWPQLASEYWKLTMDERMRGMEVIAEAHRGRRRPALVFGVQAPNLKDAMRYLEAANKLNPDAVIAIPPKEAKTLKDYGDYYGALASATGKPLFMQTTGGAEEIEPTIEFLVEMAGKHQNLGYIKEEYQPIVGRMIQLDQHRPRIRAIFSGGGGRAMTYEMRLGMDGTMPGSAYADLYPQIWDAFQAGNQDRAREIFSKLGLMLNCDRQVPGARQYIMQKRGVFKTTVSRLHDYTYTPAAIAEIEYNWAACKPYLRY